MPAANQKPETELPMHETPEFRAAVAEQAKAVAEQAVKELLAEAARVTPAAPVAPGAPVPENFEGLAMAIANLTSQGNGGRQFVPPEEIKRRQQGKARMLQIMAECREVGEVPVYELTAKTYIDEVMIDPLWLDAAKRAQKTRIEYEGEPNESMVPVNEAARLIHAAFMESIGNVIKVVDQANPYITPRGVVINGRAPARRGDQPQDAATGHGGGHGSVRVLRDEALRPGEYKSLNVLGTLAEPARQSA